MSFWTPHIDSPDFLEKGKFILAWRLTILFCFVFLTLAIVFSVGTHKELWIYILCTIVAIGSLFYLKRTKKSLPIYWFLSIVGTIIAGFTLNAYPHLIHYGDLFWMILIISFSFFGLGIRVGILFLFLNLTSIIFYITTNLNTNILQLKPLNLETKFALIVELSIAVICIGYVIYQFVSIHKQAYSQLFIANNKLLDRNAIIEEQNEEKTTLVKEIHHRVKNNLQIIVSLLRLQKSEIKSKEAKEQFSQAINRIMVMSLIHRKLYQENELAKVKIASYLQELSEDIKSLSDTGFRTKINVHSEIEKVGLKTIVPLGLLINELVSNSIKHAFSEITSGEIQIQITQLSEDDFNLTYLDNGQWSEPKNTTTFGLELIQILAEQLDGEVKRESSKKGTLYTFKLKNIDIEK